MLIDGSPTLHATDTPHPSGSETAKATFKDLPGNVIDQISKGMSLNEHQKFITVSPLVREHADNASLEAKRSTYKQKREDWQKQSKTAAGITWGTLRRWDGNIDDFTSFYHDVRPKIAALPKALQTKVYRSVFESKLAEATNKEKMFAGVPDEKSLDAREIRAFKKQLNEILSDRRRFSDLASALQNAAIEDHYDVPTGVPKDAASRDAGFPDAQDWRFLGDYFMATHKLRVSSSQ